MLAYGRIPEVNLGFLKLGPSKAGQESGEALPVPADSVLRQFMGKEQKVSYSSSPQARRM